MRVRDRWRAARDFGQRYPALSAAGWMLFYLGSLQFTYWAVFLYASYYALQAPEPDAVRIAETVVMAVPVVLLLPQRWERLSTIFAWVMVAIAFIPQLAIYGMRPESRLFMWEAAGFWALFAALTRWLPEWRMARPAFLERHAMLATAALYSVFAAVAVAVGARYLGTGVLKNLVSTGSDLSGAYANRFEFSAAHLPLNGYYFHWLALVFNPAFFVVALLRRRWWPAAVLIFGSQLLIGAVVGMRSYFFALIYAAVVAFIASRKDVVRALAGILALISLAGFAFYYAVGDPLLYLFFTGRFLLDAAQITFFYLDFFTKNGPIPGAYLLKFYLHVPYPWHYPYADNPANTVSIAYFHQNLAAVSGVVGDAYMNLGVAGLVLWAAGLGVLGRVMDACARGLSTTVASAVIAMSMIALVDTYTVRVLFTTGLLWALLLLFVFPRRARAEEEPAPAPVPAHAPEGRSAVRAGA